MNRFPIGFWNILNADDLNEKAVEDWADFGATLTISPIYSPDQDKAAFIRMLDACVDRGFKLIIWDTRADYTCVDSGHYEQDVREMLADFAAHPAVYGFHLGDEPNGDQTEKAILASQIFARLRPDKKGYLNLLPWYSDAYGGVEARVAISGDYKQYLIDFIRRSKLPILSYDCYFQLEEHLGEPTERAWETYYRNLRIFKEAADETGVPLWYTTLAVGHMYYRCPTQDDIRWEISTAVACGVNALFYWFLYSGHYNANYRNAPINELFERTETFRYISTENRLFQKVYGPLFLKLKLQQVYHTVRAYGGYPLLEQSDESNLLRVYATNGVPLLVSRFVHPEDEAHIYYAIVCNSVEYPASVYIEWKGNKRMYEVRCDLSEDGSPQLIPRGDGDRLQYWFAPGQMWVIAIDAQAKVTA